DENPIRILRDYSKPSHEGYMNTIELLVGNNMDPSPHGWILLLVSLLNSFQWEGLQNSAMTSLCSNNIKENLSQKHRLVSRTYSKKSLIMALIAISTPQNTSKTPDRRLLELEDQIKFLLKGSQPTPRPSSIYVPQAYAEAVYSNFRPQNQNETPKQNPFTFLECTRPNPQPQALGTTFKARVQDYMAAYTERMERFENAIFKQREEINDRMTEIEEEEKADKCDVATDDGSKKTDGPNMEVSVKEAKTKNGAENRTKNKPIKKAEKEEAVEAPTNLSSIAIGGYGVSTPSTDLVGGGEKRRSPVLWVKIGESSLIGHKLVQETTDKVSPWKGVIRFGTKGRLAPRYVGPLEILDRIDPEAYRLRLPEELSYVHNTFYVLNLKKCLAEANLHMPLDEIKIDKTHYFAKEPVEIMDREVRSLKRSKISLVKVRWNLKLGPEFTWEREDHIKSKYPQLLVDHAVEPVS
nr:putative reverse transcriptase domain-containing protein [Tanacetum cinerariifolium]